MQTRSPYSGKRHFLTANACKNFLLWGGRATENNKTCLTIPSWSKKSQGRLPRPVKVKNLTPQEKVKQWIQTLPPTRTATSEPLLIIKMKTQMQVQLEIWCSYLNSFTLGWQGNNRHSCKSTFPSLSLPSTRLSVHYPVEYKYFWWLLCERSLVLSTTNKMMPHRSRRIYVPDMLTM